MAATNRMHLIYVSCLLTFLLLAGFGYYMKAGHMGAPAPIKQNFVSDMTYYDLPRMTLAVGSGSQETHMRIDISLEVSKKDLPMLEGFQPKITDKLNMFLINLKPDDMRRYSTVSWLRDQMLEQVNDIGAPVPVHALVLRQMVIM